MSSALSIQPARCSPFFSVTLLTAYAQAPTATLGGIVVDENGALIRSANVTILNNSKTLERLVATGEEGTFTFHLLPPDSYIIRAQCDGFSPVEIQNIVLNANDQHAIRIQMKVGNVGESITINEKVEVQESRHKGSLLDREFINDLPINGRSFQSLITLLPGVVLTKATIDEQGQFSVTGQRANANYFTVDGVSVNTGVTANYNLGQAGSGSLPGLSATGGTNSLVSVEAVQEFKLQTSTYAPEFGRTPGGQISFLTRSGSNRFSGALFDYFRNDALDANDWFANRDGLKKAALRQNDFGGVVGGPVLLPGLSKDVPLLYDGRDRTFFFFSYEGLRLRQPLYGITTVPSTSVRGTASEPINAILNAYPLPNGKELGNGLATFSATYSDPSSLDTTSFRFDHKINDRQSLFVRLSSAPSQIIQRASSLSQSLVTSFNHRAITAGATQSFTPRITNDFRINLTRSEGESFNRLDNFGGAIPPDDKMLFPPFTSPTEGLTSILVDPLQPLVIGKNVNNTQRQLNLVDNLSLDSGSHNLKFGIDFRRLSPINDPRRYELTVNFMGVTESDSFIPSPGTLLSEKPRSVSYASRDAVTLSFLNFSAYAQDSWRITPRLILNFGLRWELNTPPQAIDGKELYTVNQLDDLSSVSLAPRGTPLWQTGCGNLAPRIGVAYQLLAWKGWETMLRGGFGIFYDLGTGTVAANASSFPYFRSRRLDFMAGLEIDYPVDPALISPLPLNLEPPYDSFEVFDPELQLPRTLQWSLALEQTIDSDQTLFVTYVGAAGRQLLRREALRGIKNFKAPLFVTRNTADSDYHALQIQFQRRLSRGLQMYTAYTWSHSIDVASNDSAPLTPAERLDPSLDRGSSDFDVRHSLAGAMSYQVPTLNVGSLGRAFLRQWSIDTIFRAQTATPLNITYLRDIGILRPDYIPGVPFFIDDPNAPGGKRLNTARVSEPGNSLSQIGPFLIPDEVRQGTFSRNALRAYPFWQVDFALRRQFNLTERMKLHLKAEFYNLFNHPNFGDPRSSLSDPLFGSTASMLNYGLGTAGINGGLNPVYQVGGPRSVQLALKLAF